MGGRWSTGRRRIAPASRSGKLGLPAAVALMAVALAAALCAGSAAAGSGWTRLALATAEGERHYWQSGGLPGNGRVLILLQGALQEPRAFAASTGLPELAADGAFTLVVPETLDGHWNDGRRSVYFGSPSTADDLGFLTGLLDRLVADGMKDPGGLYLAGFSNGGLMALTLACRAGPVAPAGLIVAAATLSRRLATDCRAPQPMSLLLANGTADPLFPYAGGMGLVNGRSGEPMLGAAETAALFARRNGCGRAHGLAASVERMGRGSAVAVEAFADCPAGGQVVEVTVTDGGHEWPPGAAEALGAVLGRPDGASLADLALAVIADRLRP